MTPPLDRSLGGCTFSGACWEASVRVSSQQNGTGKRNSWEAAVMLQFISMTRILSGEQMSSNEDELKGSERDKRLDYKTVEENQWRAGWGRLIWTQGPQSALLSTTRPNFFCQSRDDCVLRRDVTAFSLYGSVLSWWKSWVYEVSLRRDCNQKVLQVSCSGSSSVPVGRQRLWCLAEVSSPPSGTGPNLHN